MSLWILFQRWAVKHFTQLTGRNLLFALLGYILTSWILLFIANEIALTHSITNFIYYLFVTASTVGYGDLSPTTPTGKWIVALFIIPGGLGLFALTIGRVTSNLILYWRSGLLGRREVKLKNHILILGWNEKRTLHLIKMLQYEEKGYRPIVLCTRSEIENPLPGEIEFVRINHYTNIEEMRRTSLEQASCIIIDNPEDDITFTAALVCANYNPKAHILVYFNDDSLTPLLKLHCPNAECIPSVDVEMLAKSAIDPGSSKLHHELLSTHEGMTQYSVKYPIDKKTTQVSELFSHLKIEHDAILIAIENTNGIIVNPALSQEIRPEDTVYYIADERIRDFRWP
ncbi:TPA: ion channel [Photobacterium damselae]